MSDLPDQEHENKPVGGWVRETVNPFALGLVTYGLLALVVYDAYKAFQLESAHGFQHLAAALVPVVLLVYVILKTEGKRTVELGALSFLVAGVALAVGFFLGSWFRPSFHSVTNVLVMSATASVLLLLRARTEGELTHDVAYGLLLGLLLDLTFGSPIA